MGIYDRDYMKRPRDDEDPDRASFNPDPAAHRASPFADDESKAALAFVGFIDRHKRLLRNIGIGFAAFAILALIYLEAAR